MTTPFNTQQNFVSFKYYFSLNFYDGFAMLLGLTGGGNLLTLVGTGNTGDQGTGRAPV